MAEPQGMMRAQLLLAALGPYLPFPFLVVSGLHRFMGTIEVHGAETFTGTFLKILSVSSISQFYSPPHPSAP